MTGTADFPLWNSGATQRRMAELAFALLRMQAVTPAGEWVDERFAGEYREIRDRARSLAGEAAAEDLFLSLLTHVLLSDLVAATGIREAEWLDRMRADCDDRVPSSGTGVWGPHELRLGG